MQLGESFYDNRDIKPLSRSENRAFDVMEEYYDQNITGKDVLDIVFAEEKKSSPDLQFIEILTFWGKKWSEEEDRGFGISNTLHGTLEERKSLVDETKQEEIRLIRLKIMEL